MLLSNDRVRLRALEPEDLELLYRWENDPELWEVGNTLAPYSRYILKEYIAGSDRSIYETPPTSLHDRGLRYGDFRGDRGLIRF